MIIITYCYKIIKWCWLRPFSSCLVVCIIFICLGLENAQARRFYQWLEGPVEESIAERIPPPPGYRRMTHLNSSFGAWLAGLPLQPERPKVHLFNGQEKVNQRAHHSIIQIDTGNRDLQQCADAVIRLRAEYLFDTDRKEAIEFHFTSGDLARWVDWQNGIRPMIEDNKVLWKKTGSQDKGYLNFRKYLNIVFAYAGSYSLSRELVPVPDPSLVEPGDVFIQGGHPGHAVIVVAVARNDAGQRCFLIAQSYMPAQEIHILKNPASWSGPWYRARSSGPLQTPEWNFKYEDLRRFPTSP